jgi:hypothetical protein
LNRRIFVDTLFVIALVNQRDQYHQRASKLAGNSAVTGAGIQTLQDVPRQGMGFGRLCFLCGNAADRFDPL